MINKRLGVLLFVFGLIVLGSIFVSAQNDFWDNVNPMGDVFQNTDLFNLQTGALKVVFLAILIVLIFAGLMEADFPKSTSLKFIISVLLGYLATILITGDEITAAMLSYKAFGVALILFIPIMGLGFVTYVSVQKGKGVFIVAQRLLWLAYAMFLIIYVIGLVLLRWDVGFGGFGDNGKINESLGTYTTSLEALRNAQSELAKLPVEKDSNGNPIGAYKTKKDLVDGAQRNLDASEEKLPALINQYRFIFGPKYLEYGSDEKFKVSNTTLLILSVMAIFVLVVFVINNNNVVAYLEKDISQRDIDEERNLIKKSHARDVANAEVVGKR
ncbi:hypothetical protein J4423_00430 [Candidatus Pacearchaeota archaeon]|nr:hypothetical protein [Candidatus Pacearchaeota archaeon]